MSDVKQFKARAVLGKSRAVRTLVLSRRLGETFTVTLHGEKVEITIVGIGRETVAVAIETAETNLIMRKELETQ